MEPMNPAEPTIRFNAKLDVDRAIALPKIAGLPANATVEGTIDGFPFRATTRDQKIRLTENQQRAAGIKSGDEANVEITRVGDEPEVRVPEDLQASLRAHKEAHELFQKITPKARREWVRWIASAKQEETRQRRIEVGIDKLNKGMRRPCCFPGLNWVTKDHVTPEETWAPLPGSKK